MQGYNRFTLGEIVNTQVLQEIQDKFSEATGLAAVIVDVEGMPVTKPSNFTEFCQYIRSDFEGLARCMACDDRGGRKALQSRRPYVYHCHAGLTDLAAPIIVQNQYVGALLAGQVVSPQEDYDTKGEMYKLTASLKRDNDKLSELFDKVDIIQGARLKAAADLIYIMSNYIVEIGVANIVQKQLMDEIRAKAELENLLRATELKALQSQVNPHFLFNTLNTIARLALLEGASRTQEIVYALSDLLRNNLRDIEELRTLEEEVKSISDYLTIQRARFGDRINAKVNVDSQVLDVHIPALTLQPIVENAIIHGLEPKKDGGEIHISASNDEGYLMLVVSDTGIGLSQERINSIFRSEKRKHTKGQTTGLGIINVHKRIQHHFGSEYGLRMESEMGKGTSIYIRLPLCQS
ncbi:sensor histidine kinase [Dendrosporobacter sp. 1207_IL3150]|uniref:sensor histidine kinase n=1 Tax=Dendrosporobacter sp. 1207_IL3150 TaxID=3084054 RepID=UPI002FD8C306